MRNWSTDISKLAQNPTKMAIWELEQMVNFGLQGKKINVEKLRTYWNDLKLDPYRRNYLASLIYAS
ncbi:MAG: hypothetical protein AAB590_03100 [Patescibacteria group bacterium]